MRWKCICSYDGTDFEGWQRQRNGLAVQNVLEAALSQIFNLPLKTHGSGRTDAGVHARGQCFHFDGDWPHDTGKLIRALHSILPKSLRIERIDLVDERFHARHSAIGKRYVYRYHLGRAHPLEQRYVWACRDTAINFGAMQEAALRLVGTHDFSAYGATHGKDSDPNPVKNVYRLDLVKHGRQIILTTEGSGYLYRMVRSFAGALYSVGRDRLSPDDIEEILRSKIRTHRIVTAPGVGLCLDEVFYPASAN
ncbi:tRNA pseudouridine(38-40) synthase TruA [Coraliomargarita akajimensis]|uniref:tRNA pseudouridine synthase A n=1 Tax=Coraliomargarita akajimensis (strain DSM 45221 / IAM 15411 / JCM 23193 / KCTC 12865 / 04OKA010-24) TaxID=583355 RepID=D5EKS9_CORAD|nr:tRNA pseudouridine(38-40) synthase TruA [Coraliomargarita akajimensis]ADE54986.1 tRNA pseudouridine synthase A [Coraliomargarita akajimensis DSM 45221]